MFAKAREKARQTNCLANTKQLSLAVNMYTSDYDEMLPSEDFDLNGNGDANEVGIDGSWRGVIAPYVKNVQMWICPSHTPAAPVFDGRMNDDGMNASYAINDTHQDAGAPTPPSFQSLAVIEDASSVIFTIESIGNEDDLTGDHRHREGGHRGKQRDAQRGGERGEEQRHGLSCRGGWPERRTQDAPPGGEVERRRGPSCVLSANPNAGGAGVRQAGQNGSEIQTSY